MTARQRRQANSPEPKGLVETTAEKVKDSILVFWDDLPIWQQDNHYILSGYRPASGSYWKSLASLGYLHNESVNIYTHLLGAIGFGIVSVVLYRLFEPGSSAASADIAAFACFFLGAVLCLGISAGYHAICNHSHEVAAFGNKLDYVGIVFLIAGSFVPSIYYGFLLSPPSPDLILDHGKFFVIWDKSRALLIVLDLYYRLRLCLRLDSASVSNVSLATFSSWHVRFDGPFSCVSSLAWCLPLWDPADEEADGYILGNCSGGSVYCRSRALRCKFLRRRGLDTRKVQLTAVDSISRVEKARCV